jgi:hypothetical protein
MVCGETRRDAAGAERGAALGGALHRHLQAGMDARARHRPPPAGAVRRTDTVTTHAKALAETRIMGQRLIDPEEEPSQ